MKNNNVLYFNKKQKRDKVYHLKNREKRLQYARLYNKKNTEKRRFYFKNRYHNDTDFRLIINIRNRVRMALNRNTKSGKTIELIGCSIDVLKKHLELKFKHGMSWGNYGEWQIDHIEPCSSFDMSSIDAQKECFHYSNLQPLWMLENRLKSNKKEVYYR